MYLKKEFDLAIKLVTVVIAALWMKITDEM